MIKASCSVREIDEYRLPKLLCYIKGLEGRLLPIENAHLYSG